MGELPDRHRPYGQTLQANGYTWPTDIIWRENYNGAPDLFDAFIFDHLSATQTTYPKDTLSVYNRSAEGGEYRIRHYKQELSGNYPTTASNVNRTDGGNFTFTNKYTGFTVTAYRIGNGQWNNTSADQTVSYSNNLYIRHSRNSYTLEYFNHTAVVGSLTETVLFEASLSGFDKSAPGRPSDMDAAYKFRGWFKDSAGVVPFDFNQTMPANNLVVYAKWTPDPVKGVIHLSISGDGR